MRLSSTADGGTVRSDLRHRINALFDEAGINLASPRRDVQLDMGGPLEVRVLNPPTTSFAEPYHANGRIRTTN
jgi:small-conductance mechanosensitive channel